jgi:cytoskeleton protein RodZ
MSALGDTFRTARESQGLTLEDVADRIHIRSRYLEAIEAGNWAAIGPPVYIRGFVRTYARSLGLDADAAVARLAEDALGHVSAPAFAPPARPEVPLVERAGAAKRRPSSGAIAGVFVAVALVLFVGYQYFQYQRGETVPVKAAPSSAPAQPPARRERAARQLPPLVQPASGFSIRLRDSSWLRVVVDGKLMMEGIYPKGTRRTFAGRSATVRVGNAGGVVVSVDGKELGPMGGLGDVAERSYQL